MEVGSWLGKSAHYLARELQLRGKTNPLYCVDTCQGPDLIADVDDVFGQFLQNMRSLHGRVIPLRMDSVAAADQFADNSLMAVFIDADHSYDAVQRDLAAWYPKVCPGGLFFGHDYVPTHAVSRAGVVRAVDEFFADKALELRPQSRVWKHVKPGAGLRLWS